MTDTPEARPDQPADHVTAAAASDTIGSVPGARLHPWARYWAKMLDMALFSFVAGFPVGFLGLSGRTADIWAWVLFLIFYPLVEGLVVARTTGSPGKALFGITVTDQAGAKLGLKTSLKRSYSAMLWGLAAAIPFLSFASMAWFGYRDYTIKGVTRWDRDAGAAYTARPTGKSWIVLCIIALVVFILCFLIAAASVLQE